MLMFTGQRRTSLLARRYANRRTQSAVTSLVRQRSDMNSVKREKWTEADLDALPLGEHDYFERKSGPLFAKPDEALGAAAKALSAFANSGGGHLILGIDNAGVLDGIPWSGEIECGHNPWLYARLVDDLTAEELADGTETVRWKEIPNRTCVGSASLALARTVVRGTRR